MTDWVLYLDESGQFEKQHDAVTVAGLLVNMSLPGPTVQAVDAVLRRRFPELPWPFHRTYLDQVAYVALAAAIRTRERPGGHYPAGLVSAAQEAAARLELHAPEETRAVLQALERRREPAYAHVSRLSRLLWDREPALARVFEDRTREIWAQVRQAAGLIAGSPPGPRGFLAVSSETRLGDGGGDADERYFGLLEALLRRTLAVLRSLAGEHCVSVRVLGRNVVDSAVSAPRRLMMQDVDRVIAKVVSDGTPSVRFRAEGVVRYDSTIEVQYVLADFFANQTRRVLRDPGCGLADAERALSAGLGLAVRSGAPPRTHLAATGDAQRYVTGEIADLQDGDGRRRWAVEQAREWGPHA